jgi:hypothetical protein
LQHAAKPAKLAAPLGLVERVDFGDLDIGEGFFNDGLAK